MKTKDILETLKRSFTHEYILTNTYIFNWESDFFAISKSGLIHEIEVKVSRSDFFADFKKVKKHEQLKIAKKGGMYFTIRKGLNYQYDREDWRDRSRVTTVKGSTRDLEAPEMYREQNLKETSSSIQIKKTFAPNKFFYACPEGLIKKEFDMYPKLLEAIRKAIQRGMDANPQWKLTVATGGDSQKAIDWWLTGKTMTEYFTDYKIEKLTDEKGKKIGWKRIDAMFKQASLF